MEIVAVETVAGEARADSRHIAQALGNKHKNVLSMIEDYRPDFEAFGALAFEARVRPGQQKSGGGLPERYAMLNEDQCYFLLTLVRNSEASVPLKRELVRAFAAYRRGEVASTPVLAEEDPLLAQLAITAQMRREQLALSAQVAQQGQAIAAVRAELAQEAIKGAQISAIYKLGQQLGKLMGGTKAHYNQAWRLFKDRFDLASYRDLPRCQFEEGIRFLTLQVDSYTGRQAPLLGGEA